MKLETISIKRFRSIENTEVERCGGFNVLIGKNNSGKSNILSTIRTFFDCIEDGNVVTLRPPIGKEIDFFERKTELPIEITLTFRLALAERDALIRDIVTEASQMKNALDGLDPSLRLSVTVCIAPPPAISSYSFVSKIVLGGTIRPGAGQPDPVHTILSLSKETALELYNNLSRVSQSKKRVQGLSKLLKEFEDYGPRVFEEILSDKRRSVRPSGIFDVFPSRFMRSIDEEFRSELDAVVGEVTSYEEFKSAIQALTTRKEKDITQVQGEPLRNKIDTFSGEESSMPTYVQNLLRSVGSMEVLYLQERREPIGKREAAQLLSLKMTRGGPQVLRSIQETVSALLGVQIDAFQSGPPSVS